MNTRIVLAVLLVAAYLPVFAGTPVPDYIADKISEHVYVIHGPTDTPNSKNLGFINNPALVIGSDSAMIFDPGSSLESGRMVLRQLKQLTDKPVTHVFNSHVHGDHWLGNQAIREAYPDASFYAHPEMIKRAKESEAEEWVENMLKLTERATEGTVALIPELELSNGQEISSGNLTVRIHIVPAAHSHTDAMFEIVEDSLLYTGDNVTYLRMPRFDDGTFRGTLAACDHALSLNLKHYVPGHGPTGGPEVVESFRNYVGTLYEMVVELYDEGLADFEMKPKIVEALKEYQSWASFDRFVGRTISLAVLEAEKAAFE